MQDFQREEGFNNTIEDNLLGVVAEIGEIAVNVLVDFFFYAVHTKLLITTRVTTINSSDTSTSLGSTPLPTAT